MPVRSARPARVAVAPLLAVLAWTAGAAGARRVVPSDPDQLYAHREVRADAERAAGLWARDAHGNYDAAWKLSRACYWLGTHGPVDRRRDWLQRGVAAGQRAERLNGAGPEGHFWSAANMAGLAESFGFLEGLKYRGRIRRELRRVIALQPGWEGGSAEAALGRWYYEVPSLLGGSLTKAEEYLRRALRAGPDNMFALLYLSDVLSATGRRTEARTMLERIVAAPLDPEWAPEERELKRKAAERLAR